MIIMSFKRAGGLASSETLVVETPSGWYVSKTFYAYGGVFSTHAITVEDNQHLVEPGAFKSLDEQQVEGRST